MPNVIAVVSSLTSRRVTVWMPDDAHNRDWCRREVARQRAKGEQTKTVERRSRAKRR